MSITQQITKILLLVVVFKQTLERQRQIHFMGLGTLKIRRLAASKLNNKYTFDVKYNLFCVGIITTSFNRNLQ